MSKYSAITVQNQETGKEEKVYWKKELYNYNEEMIESIQTRVADRFGGLVWKAMPDTYESSLEDYPDIAIDYEDLN